MKSFFRENPTIAFSLGLPLLVVVVFFLISWIPTILVASPQYDMLYATEYYNQQSAFQISVVAEKIKVTYQGNKYSNRKPRLWRFHPKTGAVREIAMVLPPQPAPVEKKTDAYHETPESTLVDVPDLEGIKIDSSNIAPDGYEFSETRARYPRGLFGFGYSSRYRNGAALTKNGRSVPLPLAFGPYTHFIGWVVSP